MYSLPTRLIGKYLRARADSQLVRFYDGGVIVKTHPRQPRGGKSIDPTDFPKERRPYAMRDVTFLHGQARELGESVKLLDAPLPWTKMRGVRALIGLARRFGAERLDAACARALAADMLSVHRLARMLEMGVPPPSALPSTNVIPLGRYLQPAETYAMKPRKEERQHDR